jgi:hypothetical protein
MTYKLKVCTKVSQHFLPTSKRLLVFIPGISAISLKNRYKTRGQVRTGEQTEQIYISSLGGELERFKGELKSKKAE